jgi:hypothetical protein
MPLGALAFIAAAVYAAALNRNALYLSLLFSASALALLCLSRTWARLVILVGAAGLALFPLRGVGDLGRLFPAPRDIPGADRFWCTALPPGQTWTYRFTVMGLGPLETDGAAAGTLYVDGRSLGDLEIRVNGKAYRAAAYTTPKVGMDHVAIPIRAVSGDRLTVSLRQAGPLAPKLFRGTEVHVREVYPDAVWLEFDKGRDRAIYETVRLKHPPVLSQP